MAVREEWEIRLDRFPSYMRDGMRRHIALGQPTGDFLHAIFSNDFARAVGHADSSNGLLLREYANFLTFHAPAGSWGSVQAVKEWRAIGGLQGFRAIKKEGTPCSEATRS